MTKGNGSAEGIYSEELTPQQEQEIVELGTRAAEALNNPIFLIEYQLLRSRYFEQFAKGTNDGKTLMQLQDKVQVLDEIYQDFVGMRNHAQRILEERQMKNSQEYKEQQRLDTQGFGLNFNQ